MSKNAQAKGHSAEHPYLTGNFAPLTESSSLTPTSYVGSLPKELHGGMYVRNGGNPISNSDLGREAHWFDGDGMLTGVWFDGSSPHFVNQYILTDLCISSFENDSTLRKPILPSIATLVSPFSSLMAILWSILRTVLLVLLSHLPGSQYAIKRISVANTAFVYHDGRALATCESGPPIRVQLPGLETVGWFDGNSTEGEPSSEHSNNDPSRFGGTGPNSWMREWTTGHPKVDPATGEMLLFHCNFLPPFVHYSVVPRLSQVLSDVRRESRKLMNVPVPGCSGGKMMHDWGVSRLHTVLLDLPLTLSPFNLLKNQPVVAYEPKKPSRFGVFPRYNPSAVRWFETSGCCIFHTANTWDECHEGNTTAVNLLACRLTSASLVFSAGNITPPPHPSRTDQQVHRPISFFAKYDEDEQYKDPEKTPCEEKTTFLNDTELDHATGPPTPPISEDDHEQCRLYYYRFSLASLTPNNITDQYALSTIPFEFPTVSPQYDMSFARYIYGCSTTNASFGAALGKATKIDIIVKMNIHALLSRAKSEPPQNIHGSVDTRCIQAILASSDPEDPIQAFQLPPHHFAQEARFVPRADGRTEDDGYLLFYVFDESQLDERGQCRKDAKSELWVLDARDMRTVVCKVRLPTRVPYGLHGNWFNEKMIREQREVECVRRLPTAKEIAEGKKGAWGWARQEILRVLG